MVKKTCIVFFNIMLFPPWQRINMNLEAQ